MARPAQKFDRPPASAGERLVVTGAVIPHLATDEDIARLEGRMDAMGDRLIKWLVGTAVAIVSVYLAAQIGIAFLVIRAVSGD